MRAWLPLSCFLLLTPFASVRAADLDEAKVAQIADRLRPFIEKNQISGAVAVVGTSKGVARIVTVGLHDIEKKQAMKEDSLFRIASMTKPITALGIMILVEREKLKLDDPVEKYLPEFRGQMVIEKKDRDTVVLRKPKRPITLRDLLTHTSGLPGYGPGLAELYVRRDHTLAEATLAVSQKPLDFEPGSKWAYCNSGIDVLGRLIEVASGQSFEKFLHANLFAPLGMKDTVFYPDVNQAGRIATLYGTKDGKLVAAPDSIIGPGRGAKHPIPAGGLYSTGPDLAKLYRMMLNQGQFRNDRIIREESIKEMTRLQTGELLTGFTSGMGFGLGWAVVRKPEGVTAMLSKGAYGHGGAFGTQAWLDPKKDLFVVLLIQRTGMPGGDASEVRRVLQTAAVEAIRK